ncbi:hypothetical protein ScPMuIL_015146 [Solemya velum]
MDRWSLDGEFAHEDALAAELADCFTDLSTERLLVRTRRTVHHPICTELQTVRPRPANCESVRLSSALTGGAVLFTYHDDAAKWRVAAKRCELENMSLLTSTSNFSKVRQLVLSTNSSTTVWIGQYTKSAWFSSKGCLKPGRDLTNMCLMKNKKTRMDCYNAIGGRMETLVGLQADTCVYHVPDEEGDGDCERYTGDSCVYMVQSVNKPLLMPDNGGLCGLVVSSQSEISIQSENCSSLHGYICSYSDKMANRTDTPVPWDVADDRCRESGGQLIGMDAPELNKEHTCSCGRYWIGLVYNEQIYKDTINWNISGTTCYTVDVRGESEFREANCSETHPYICEERTTMVPAVIVDPEGSSVTVPTDPGGDLVTVTTDPEGDLVTVTKDPVTVTTIALFATEDFGSVLVFTAVIASCCLVLSLVFTFFYVRYYFYKKWNGESRRGHPATRPLPDWYPGNGHSWSRSSRHSTARSRSVEGSVDSENYQIIRVVR